MPTLNEPITIFDQGWVIRYQRPAEHSTRTPILLLHGWTGDENSMWVFAGKLAQHHFLVAPRGPISATPGGFGWVSQPSMGTPYITYKNVAIKLLDRLDVWEKLLDISFSKIRIAGFSQGAALAGVLALEEPQRIERLAMLAGYLPKPAASIRADLNHLPCFIAHGVQDTIVPVSYAQESAAYLKGCGAQVSFCQADVGHKLSANCFNGLESFLSGG